jgi:tRNA pseudouridine38-40 synthase
MGRFRLDVAYDGTGFSGWQVQPGKRTVQGELEGLLERLGETARPTGAGRTDAGVHALDQVAHVDLDRDWHPAELIRALRDMTPEDVRVLGMRPVGPDFHARYSARSRTYHYALALEHNPFFRTRRWVVPRLPDSDWANQELLDLRGEQDFASLAKSGGGTESSVCRLEAASWIPFPGGAVLTLVADRFLYGMVRALAGTLVRGFERGEPPGHLRRVLDRRSRDAAGVGAPAQGLYLAGIGYAGEPAPRGSEASVCRFAALGETPGTPWPGRIDET